MARVIAIALRVIGDDEEEALAHVDTLLNRGVIQRALEGAAADKGQDIEVFGCFARPGAAFDDPPEGWAEPECDECGATIPPEKGGGLANKHHHESCSLHDPNED